MSQITLRNYSKTEETNPIGIACAYRAALSLARDTGQAWEVLSGKTLIAVVRPAGEWVADSYKEILR